MNAKKKKPAARRRSGARRVSRGLAGRVKRVAVLCLGLGLGLFAPWLAWLNHLVTSEFEGRKWDVPSRVFARPLTLYPGMALSRDGLGTELEVAGYRRTPEATEAGAYSISGGRYTIYRRDFRFDDGPQAPLRFVVGIDDGQVSVLTNAAGAPLDIVRLDPAEIASIYPLHDEDRSLVAIGEVPELLLTGLQAVEDRQFKSHPGVHLRGIARAFWANLRAGETVQGGSTLTQQLIKNYYLSDERRVMRKINEGLMALLLELHYDKAEILEAYLNEIYLGQQGAHGIHGFGRASEFYFGQPLAQLGTEQIALLVGMVRGASLYNPRRNPERALARRNRVLAVFRETGLLAAAEAEAAAAQPLGVIARPSTGGSRYPAFIDLVRRQLHSDYREQDLQTAGLRIFTTLSPADQQAAERAVVEGMRTLGERGLPASLQCAVLLADVASGEVRAVVGDREPGRVGFNRALDARRQIGSVVKPLVYLSALEHQDDYDLLTPVRDEPITLRQPDGSLWAPENFDRESHGEVPLLDALVHSYNQATVRVGMQVGVQQLVTKLRLLGIEQAVEAVPAALLGAVELTPLEVAQVYQSLASSGFSVRLRAVTSVQTAQGESLGRYPLRLLPLPRRDALAVLNFALTQVVERGTARELPGLLGSDVAIAGKTGTTNEQRDSWFVGYTRDRVAVTWVGNDDNTPAGVTGSNAAMRLWAGLFLALPLKPVDLDMPDGAYWVWVEPGLDALSDPSCPNAVQMPFIAGTEPVSESPCLARLEAREMNTVWRKWFDRD